MGDLKSTILREKILPLAEKLSTLTVHNYSSLVNEVETLKRYCQEHRHAEDLNVVIDLIKMKMEDQKLELIHAHEIDQLSNKIRELEFTVTSITIPVVRNLTELFKSLMKEASALDKKIENHKDNCYAIANLRDALKDIRLKIERLKEDNNIQLGWLAGGTVLNAVSIGVAFVPGVGLPIAAALASAPYLGKLFHRLIVSHDRKKEFTKNE